MNRLSAVSSDPEIRCISPLKALDSLWRGLSENVSVAGEDPTGHIILVKETVAEYGERAIREVQKAFEERFDEGALTLLTDYLSNVEAYIGEGGGRAANERDMRDMEKPLRVSDRDRSSFRRNIHEFFSNLRRRSVSFDYTTEPQMKNAIEALLFEDRRKIERALSRPRLARHQAEWARRRASIFSRLIESYGYCPQCAEDTIEYVVHVLRGNAVLRSPKNEGIEWLWELNPVPPPPDDEA